MSDDVLLVDRDATVAVLTLNRPKSKNALSAALVRALGAAMKNAGEDPSVRAIVLGGAGGSFCAGADLKAAFVDDPDALDHVDRALDEYHAIIRAITAAPKPVIAMVDGPAVGFGCDLALACDMRLASDAAYFQEKFVKIGLMPDGGGTFWLPRLIGLGRAMELILTGEALSAERALALGVVNRVVPAASLQKEAMALAHALAKGPPLAFAGIKRAVQRGLAGGLDASLAAEREGQLRCLRSSDCLEGVAAWMQKREPTFQGK